MTADERLDLLNTMTGGSESPEILETYLQLAGERIMARAFPFREYPEDVPRQYHALQVEIACVMIMKRGAEGEVSHSENGISRTYGSDDGIQLLLKTITPYCGVVR